MIMGVDAPVIMTNLLVAVMTADAAMMVAAANFVTVAIAAACSSIFVPRLLLHFIFVMRLSDWTSTTS